ncbi:hypothetical protein [Micromonospora sp. NPDC047730]|uniref:hypothetical protein n=1 Tax=Micromonospora sp. NPDC047730 TaxID=3364253 RepID=UPI003724961B
MDSKTIQEAYTGREEATMDRVVRFLRDNYGHSDGSPLTEERLLELTIKHADVIRTAITLGSFAYYPGDKIAAAERLEYIGPDDEG